ncbi:MAG TPA: adenylate/guanylate cyclase domain-containing protein [Flavobacteriales bacterium]|nr:adenylate/guanylate cyclase domain-containing protein [Flavobacteriales bacterium]
MRCSPVARHTDQVGPWTTLIVILGLLAPGLSWCQDGRTEGASVGSLLALAKVEVDSGHYPRALALLDSARITARSRSDEQGVAKALVQEAVIRQIQGDYDQALALLYNALRLREHLEDTLGLAEVNNNLGALMHSQKDFTKAELYYGRSLAIYTALGLEREMATCYNNFGALHEDMGAARQAIADHLRSLAIWRALDEQGWMGVNYLHLGTCHELLGQPDSARLYFEHSAALLQGANSRYQLSLVYLALGNNHSNVGRQQQALEWCRKGLEIAEDIGVVTFQQRGCECMYRAYRALGDMGSALRYHERFMLLRDSVFSQANIKEMTRLQMDHAFAQQQLADSLSQAQEKLETDLRYQASLARERGRRNLAFMVGLGILGLAAGLLNRLRFVRRSRALLQKEKDRSEELLLNILPGEIAEELKAKGGAQARDIDGVSILFTDFKGFTQLSEQLTAQELVAEIDTCFKAFDGIIEAHGLEKIKTIGDAYMAAGGLPVPVPNSAGNTVLAALDMQAFMARYRAGREADGRPFFEMRVGIHTGPVVAGIVGVKKFQYDIWGDTVNIASRMESSGEVGQVNISEATYALVMNGPGLSFTPRGRVQAKGKGEMDMYFVRRIAEADL